jgi:hypothetical protein
MSIRRKAGIRFRRKSDRRNIFLPQAHPGLPPLAVFVFFSALLALAPACMAAQQQRRDPLTPAQVDEIRAAGIYPAERIKLYIKFLDERASPLQKLAARGRSINRTHELDGQLQDFTALLDELASNLEQYGGRMADLRPAMRPLNEACARWLQMLRALPAEPGYELALKEAIESASDLAADAARVRAEQEAYFAQHKDAAGQQRAEPQ